LAANNSTDLVNLDFDALKFNLKSYLQGQAFLQDYDFAGSTFNVLLDILAYNTQKNLFFLNMNISESFLDSAQIRDSVLSHAKDLNYTPRSARSSVARVQVDFQATQESQPYIVPKGSSFTTLIKAQSFTFSIPENIILSSANTTYSFQTDIYEGIYLKDTYIFFPDIENQRFRISNPTVDTSSLTVTVFEDNKVIGDKYNLATSLLDLDSSSKVYFLQASEKGFYEVLFGNGVIGRQPKINATIQLNYRVSSDIKSNGAKVFVANFDPTGPVSELTGGPTITTIRVAEGGAIPETLESIRYMAPRHFQVQERAVIETDTEVLLKEQFPEINAVAVFGGEKVNPPRFGKIFVSVDIANVDGLPDSKKTEYYNFLKKRCNLSIIPIFIEPEFTYIDITALVRCNLNLVDFTSEYIKSLVVSAINQYNDDFLNNFNVILRDSQLRDIIDEVNPAIISNIMTTRIYKKIQPSLLTSQNIVVDFATELDDDFSLLQTKYSVNDKTVLTSSSFRFGGQNVILADDGNGIVRIVKNDGTFITKITDIGTIDYTLGKINLNNFLIEDYEGSSLLIYVRPKDLDIKAALNTILSIESNNINVDIEFLSL